VQQSINGFCNQSCGPGRTPGASLSAKAIFTPPLALPLSHSVFLSLPLSPYLSPSLPLSLPLSLWLSLYLPLSPSLSISSSLPLSLPLSLPYIVPSLDDKAGFVRAVVPDGRGGPVGEQHVDARVSIAHHYPTPGPSKNTSKLVTNDHRAPCQPQRQAGTGRWRGEHVRRITRPVPSSTPLRETLYGDQGESLVPPYTLGSVSLTPVQVGGVDLMLTMWVPVTVSQ